MSREGAEHSSQNIACLGIIRLALLSFSISACDSERTERAAPLTVDARVNAIEAAVATMRHDTATVFGLSAEGASIDAAYADSTLRRVDAEYFGETGRARETFYLDSALFYVVRRHYTYDVPLSGRMIDSTITRHDFTLETTSVATKDSLTRSMLELMKHLPRRR